MLPPVTGPPSLILTCCATYHAKIFVPHIMESGDIYYLNFLCQRACRSLCGPDDITLTQNYHTFTFKILLKLFSPPAYWACTLPSLHTRVKKYERWFLIFYYFGGIFFFISLSSAVGPQIVKRPRLTDELLSLYVEFPLDRFDTPYHALRAAQSARDCLHLGFPPVEAAAHFIRSRSSLHAHNSYARPPGATPGLPPPVARAKLPHCAVTYRQRE